MSHQFEPSPPPSERLASPEVGTAIERAVATVVGRFEVVPHSSRQCFLRRSRRNLLQLHLARRVNRTDRASVVDGQARIAVRVNAHTSRGEGSRGKLGVRQPCAADRSAWLCATSHPAPPPARVQVPSHSDPDLHRWPRIEDHDTRSVCHQGICQSKLAARRQSTDLDVPASGPMVDELYEVERWFAERPYEVPPDDSCTPTERRSASVIFGTGVAALLP